MSAAKVALGCRLFFETRLSVTGTTSCASCHQPGLAYTDGRARAVGARGDLLKRSAMSLTNVAYNARYDWADARVTTLEQQMRLPLFGEHPIELGLAGREAELTHWLAADADYARAFSEAFPATPTPVSIGHLIQAIAAYERTLISGRSPFDRYLFDDDREAISPAAKRGMALFYSPRTGCGECHSGLNFSGASRHAGAREVTAVYANTGVAVAGGDRGLATTTMRRADAGRFRVPTLRNVALTAPYMHDGSLPTLDAVIAHYEEVGQRPRTRDSRLDPRLRRFTLSGAERDDLRAFLESLTDREFIARHVACPRR
jgi:cytochrome c peroxidase